MNHSKLFLNGTNHTRRAAFAVIGLCFLFEMMAALTAAGQTSSEEVPVPKNGSQAAQSATAIQNVAMSAMAESLAKQRASIQRQVGTVEVTGFFELPPPKRISSSLTSTAHGADCDPLPESEIGALIERAAKNELLQPELVRSVMRQESGFRPCAGSTQGAMGLMQLMPETASHFNVTNPFDAESNVNAGAKLLKQLLDRYNGSLEKALSAYNAGPATVDAAAGIPNIPETIDYVRQILKVLPSTK
jgi:soluble lytic murein transglycosylase-like protein